MFLVSFIGSIIACLCCRSSGEEYRQFSDSDDDEDEVEMEDSTRQRPEFELANNQSVEVDYKSQPDNRLSIDPTDIIIEENKD